MVAEHCSRHDHRNREIDRELDLLNRTCESGNNRTLMQDGTLADACRDCEDLDDQVSRRRRTAH